MTASLPWRHRKSDRAEGLRGATPRRRRLALAGAASLLLPALVLACVTPAGRHQLALSFTRVPAPFVELYFVNASPKRGARNELVVEFAVAAHEGGPGTYPYKVVLRDATGARLETRNGNTTIPADGRAIVAVRLDLPARGRWSSVQVRLTGRSEHLHYTNPRARLP